LRDKAALALLLVAVVGLTFVHDLKVLAALALLFVLLSFKDAKKSIKAIFLFNISVTIGYMIKAYFTGDDFWAYILRFNLRVFDISFLVFYTFSKINLLRAFSFSKSLKLLLVSTLSQIVSFQKTYEDFMLAMKSRSVRKLSYKDKRGFIASMFYFFFKKSLHNAKERTLALKARGFFDQD